MEEIDPPQKKRLRNAKAPRSRTGCRTCRTRHVKCDETRPYCKKCQVNGRNCEYTLRNVVPDPASSTSSRTTLSPNQGSAASLNLAAVLPEADAERRHFHYFQQQTAPELSGYFDYEFYSSLVLQISREQPAIRHAVIALGSLHEGTKAGEEAGGSLRNSSLLHYNKAIKNLATARGEQTISRTLICCMLFIWFETLQGNNVGRMKQLTSGLNILREWQRNVIGSSSSTLAPEVGFIRQHLVPMFTRFDLQGVSFEEGRMPQLELQLRLENPRSRGIPEAFSSVEEARDWLDVVIYWLHATVHRKKQPGPLPAPLEGHLFLERWSLAMDEFLRIQKSNLSDARIRACTILQIYQKMAVIMLASQISLKESAYEPFNPQFKVITALAESLFNASNGTAALDGFRFSFEMGVVAPLFYVSSKCQNQAIRTKAVSLLLKCPQKGGVWNGLGVAKMASMQAEEAPPELDMGNASNWAERYEAAAEYDSQDKHPLPTSNLSTTPI